MASKSADLLRVATYNVFGLPKITPVPLERMAAIGARLAELGVDIVGFQEVFTTRYRDLLLDALGLPYSQFWGDGLVGSGLLIASRYPLRNPQFVPFALKGKPEKPYHGDYYANKGVGAVTARTPWGPVEILVTHTIANYSGQAVDEYYAHRCAQMVQVVELASRRPPDHPLILMGDLNTVPDRLEYRVVEALIGLRDCWTALFPHDNTPTVSCENLLVRVRNPDQHKDERIDYVFCRSGRHTALEPQKASLALTDPFASSRGQPMACSDHYAVVTDQRLRAVEGGRSAGDLSEQERVWRELEDVLEWGIREGLRRRKRLASVAVLAGIGGTYAWSAGRPWGKRAGLLARAIAAIAGFCAWLAMGATQGEIRALKAIRDRAGSLQPQ